MTAPVTDRVSAGALALKGAVAVPRAHASSESGFAVCNLCHGPARKGSRLCWSCFEVAKQLDRRLPRVVPVFLFAPTSVPHRLLVGYKAAPSAASRAHHSSALGDVLSLFLARHQACVARDTAPVTLVPVPSSSGGRASWQGRHPLVALCEKAAEASGTSVRSCLAPGAAGTRRLAASPDGFRVVSRPSTATVVVVDDMFTSGARALSATAALEGAGLRVAAVVPLGRLVCPGHNRETAAFWREVGSRPWSPFSCCACRPRALALEVAPSAWLESARAA